MLGRRAVGLDDAVRLQAAVRLKLADGVVELPGCGAPGAEDRRLVIAHLLERLLDRDDILGHVQLPDLDPAAQLEGPRHDALLLQTLFCLVYIT